MSLRADMQQEVMLMNLESELTSRVKKAYKKEIKDCSNEELYYCLLEMVKEMTSVTEKISGEKKVY